MLRDQSSQDSIYMIKYRLDSQIQEQQAWAEYWEGDGCSPVAYVQAQKEIEILKSLNQPQNLIYLDRIEKSLENSGYPLNHWHRSDFYQMSKELIAAGAGDVAEAILKNVLECDILDEIENALHSIKHHQDNSHKNTDDSRHHVATTCSIYGNTCFYHSTRADILTELCENLSLWQQHNKYLKDSAGFKFDESFHNNIHQGIHSLLNIVHKAQCSEFMP